MYKQNKDYELSISELKKYPGFEAISEDEAKQAIQQLKELSLILYNAFQNQEGKHRKVKSIKV